MRRLTSAQAIGDARIASVFRAEAGEGQPKGPPDTTPDILRNATPNTTPTAVKDALIEAFELMGGVERLAEYAEAHPGEFYKMWIRILPQEVSGPNGGAIPIQAVARIIVDPKAADQ